MKRTPKTIATELLVLKVQSGDQAAFDELVRLWMSVLYGRCLAQLRQAEDAKDATQKAWLKAFQSIGRLKDPACFAAWLLRIGHVTCVDTIRRQVRRGQIKEQLREQAQGFKAPDDAAFDLRSAIHDLSQSQQQILDLYYVAGFSTAQIAAILAIAQGTVKSRLHSARKTLKSKLETGENNEQT